MGFGNYPPERFLENAQALDFINLQTQLNGNLNCSSNKNDVAFLKNFGANFLADFKANGVPAFNQFINNAYKYSKSKDDYSKKQGLDWLDAAVIQIQATKLILPNEKDVLDMEVEIEKAEKNIKGDIKKKESAAATSPTHLKYINQIVFSNKPIILGKENEADFKTAFKLGEKIYAVAYFKAGIKDLPSGAKEDQIIYATTSADGEGLFGQSFEYANDNKIGRKLTKTEVDKNISAWTFELIADENTATSSIPWYFADMVSRLSPRKHKISLSMNQWNKGGSFEIDLDGVDLDKFVVDAKAYSIKAADIIANNRTIPDEWKAYTKKAFKDPALSINNMKAILKENFSDLKEILRIIVLANTDYTEWEIKKNELDIPTLKVAPGVGIVYKAKDGKCYFTIGNIYRTYEGGGQYSGLKANCFTGSSTQIGCANINK
jgi:hypothetical protein